MEVMSIAFSRAVKYTVSLRLTPGSSHVIPKRISGIINKRYSSLRDKSSRYKMNRIKIGPTEAFSTEPETSWKMLFFVSCLILLAGESLCLPSANQYVDNVLHTTLQNVIRNEKYEPTHLPDYTFEYTDKTFMGKVHGKAEYKEGSLSGLSQVARLGDCQGPFNVSGSTVINCTLNFNLLLPSYKGKVKYGILPKVSIQANAEVSSTSVVVGIAKGFNEREARVKTFALRQIGQMTVHYSGLGPLNKYVKVLEENYRSRVAAEITNVIVNRFKYALNLAVAQVPMPLR